MDTSAPPTEPGAAEPPPRPAPPAGPPPAPPGPRPPRAGGSGFFEALRGAGLVRSHDRWIGGVAGGLALRLGIDPLIVRGVLALTVLLGGLGLVVYGLAWALLPDQRDGRILLQGLLSGDFDIAVIGALAVLAAGMAYPHDGTSGLLAGSWWRGSWWPFFLVLTLATLAVVLLASVGRSTGTRGPTTAEEPIAAAHPSSPAGVRFTKGPDATTTMPLAPTGAPTGATPVGPTAPLPIPTPPARPPRARPAGPGVRLVGLVVSVTLLTLAALMYAERQGQFGGEPLLTAGSLGVVLAGLAIIVSGLRGRTSGALGVFAVLAVVVLVPLTAIDRSPFPLDGTGLPVGDVRRAPSTVADAEEGLTLGAGRAEIDLRDVPLGGSTVTVPVRVGAGEVVVTVPEGADVEAMVEVYVGELEWLGEPVARAGDGTAATLRTPDLPGADPGDTPAILLDVLVGTGNVEVRELP